MMRPVLYSLRLGAESFQLHSYGVAIAVGFLAAIFLGARQARRVGEDDWAVQELCFWLLISSMVGARLLFVLTNIPEYAEACRDGVASHSLAHTAWACTRALHVWEGGLVFYGGFLAAAGFAWWYTRRKKMNFARIADLLAPSVAIGHFFGRLGCFAAGCCFGKPTSFALGMRFPAESLAFQQLVSSGNVSVTANVTMPLHPVQLYEAFGELALYCLLSLYAARKRYDGQILVYWLAGYGVLRFVTEIFRGDAVRKFVLPGVSTSQFIALLTIPLAAALAWYFKRRQVVFSRA